MVLRTRWHKVFIDLWSNRTRTLIVALAVAVGVYAVGTVVSARTLLTREFDRDQADALRATAIIHTTPFDEQFVERTLKEPGIVAAEGRSTIPARVITGQDQWEDMLVISISDFENSQVDRLLLVSGEWPLGKNEIVIEHLALEYIGAEVGDAIILEFDDGRKKTLTIVGLGQDPQKFNPDLTGFATAYVTPETMEGLGFTRAFTELHIRLSEPAEDGVTFESQIDEVEDFIKRSGRPVLQTTMMTENMVEAIVDTVVLLLTIFGFIILLLSGFLVVNTISALIAQQVKQIGVMKLVGARRLQIVSMYLLMVLVYGLLAVLIGLPLSTITARLLMTELIEGLVNIRSDSYSLPISVILIQMTIGLLLPIVAGLIPVMKGTSISTNQALSDIRVGSATAYHGIVERILARIQHRISVQRPLLLVIRNTLRHKGRLIQTLTVLIMGTTLFISVLSIRTSVDKTLKEFLNYHQYDLSIGFEDPHRLDNLAIIVEEIPGIVDFEGWTITRATRERPDGTESNSFQVIALPASSSFVDPQLNQGRWLLSEDQNAVVVNSELLDEEPNLAMGSDLKMNINGRDSEWKIVGVVRTDAQGPGAYVSLDEYGYLMRQPGQVSHIQIRTSKHDSENQTEMESALIDQFEESGYRIRSSRTSQAINSQNELMFDIIIAVLIMMAVLLAAVGGLGLTTTMSINILERIREIGVLRAIGASNASVRQIVLAEGIIIGVISWIIGLLLSFPISALLSQLVGIALLGIPLSYDYALLGAIGWFFGLLIVAVIASLGPAKDAVGLTIREVLAYE